MSLSEVRYTDPQAAGILANALYDAVTADYPAHQYLPILVCVGTTDSTGDSFGPRVGTLLTEVGHEGHLYEGRLYGTWHDPETWSHIRSVLHRAEAYAFAHGWEPLIIAIDAAVAPSAETLGTIGLYQGPFEPGSGLGRPSHPIGNLCIEAHVAYSQFKQNAGLALDNAPLALVVGMTNVLVPALVEFWQRWRLWATEGERQEVERVEGIQMYASD